MATKTLLALVADLRAELLQSVNSAHGVNLLPAHKVILARVQEDLWLDHSWAHLRVDRDIELAAGQRYYDFPTDLDMDRVENAWVKWSGRWHPLSRGINPDEHYNAQDSDLDIRADPILRWAPYETEQFEVWPMPASDDSQTVRLRGIRTLNPLVDDDDTCDLDARLIVLVAAAELAADAKSPRAQSLGSAAKNRYAKLRGRSEHGDSGRISMAGGRAPARGRRMAPPLVAVDRGN